MLVNQNGTTDGDEIIAALEEAEQEPTAENEEAGEDEADETAEEPVEGDEEESQEDDEAEEGQDEESDEGTKRYTVKLNGQEAKVSLSELKAGYMKDEDYRRKTATLADNRKRVEAKEAEYESGLKVLGEQLELTGAFIAGQVNLDDGELDKLAETNPAEFVRQQRQLAKQGNALRNVDAHLQRVRAAQAQAQQKKHAEFVEEQTALLEEANPEFRKPETRERLNKYLKDGYKLTDEEIAGVADHRFSLIAEKARRYDAIKSKAALKDKQVSKEPGRFQKAASVNRGAAVTKAKEQTIQKVMKSGRVDDLAKMF